MGRHFGLLFVGLVVASLVLPGVAAADPDITISPASISATSGTSKKSITVANQTSGTVAVSFSVEPSEEGVGVAVAPSPSVTLSGYQAQKVDLTFTSGKMNYQGYLVATSSRPDEPGSSPPPAMVPLALYPGMRWSSAEVIVSALLLGVGLVIGRWLWGRHESRKELVKARNAVQKAAGEALALAEAEAAEQDAEDKVARWQLDTRMGGVEWDYSKSYGSEFAVFGALVGLLLTAGLLPSNDDVKGAYVGLQLLFAALALIAPVVYAATQEQCPPPQDPPEPDWRPITTRLEASTSVGMVIGKLTSTREPEVLEPEILGAVGWFLAASAITCWAAFGQAVTLILLLWNIWAVHGLPDAVIWVLLIAGLVLVGLILAYFFKTIGWILEKQARGALEAAPADVPFVAIAKTGPNRPSWTPL